MMDWIRARVNPGDSSRRAAQVIHRVLTDNMDALKVRMKQEAIRRGFVIRRTMPEAVLIGGPSINHVRMDDRSDDWRVLYMKQDYSGGESLRQTNYESNEIGSLLTHPESSLADWQQYEEYKTILGKDAPKTLADFLEIKYNNDTEWSYIERLVKYLEQYPNSDKRYFDVQETLRLLRIPGAVLPVQKKQAFILPSGRHDPYHIMHRMKERQITDDEIRGYLVNAKAMLVQWGGKRQRFLGEEGMCVIHNENGLCL